VPAGEFFTPTDRQLIERAIRNAESVSGFDFSVFVGASVGEPRRFAEQLHAQLDDPVHGVLVLVDPVTRVLEIVTGSAVRRSLDDGEVGLAALSMQTAFAVGDFVSGITTGVQQLGEHARRPQMLHTDTP